MSFDYYIYYQPCSVLFGLFKYTLATYVKNNKKVLQRGVTSLCGGGTGQGCK